MSLQRLLNPKEEVPTLSRGYTPVEEPPSPAVSSDSANDATDIDRHALATHEHQPHMNCPNNLGCLPDTTGRPQHTLPIILRCAILGSPHQRLTIREIYGAMEDKYTYYRTAGQTWKQSVRHHLSLNRLFERVPRPVTEPGFGSYWTVNLDAPKGTKRPRKRGKAKAKEETPTMTDVDASSTRSRATRHKDEYDDHLPMPYSAYSEQPLQDRQLSDVRTVKEEQSWMDQDADSEEETPYTLPRQRGSVSSTSTLTGAGSPTLSKYNNKSPMHRYYTTMPIDDGHEYTKVGSELESLRRQSEESTKMASRMSEQLNEAHAEANRARAALRTTEMMLAEEARKRREAERMAEEEGRARRMAEEALARMKTRASVGEGWSEEEEGGGTEKI